MPNPPSKIASKGARKPILQLTVNYCGLDASMFCVFAWLVGNIELESTMARLHHDMFGPIFVTH